MQMVYMCVYVWVRACVYVRLCMCVCVCAWVCMYADHARASDVVRRELDVPARMVTKGEIANIFQYVSQVGVHRVASLLGLVLEYARRGQDQFCSP